MSTIINVLIYLLITVVAAAAGVLATIWIQNRTGRSRARTIIDEATRQGEVIRQE